jgi:tripartite-type tricarboxylate transporter receptor subunit TctC
MKTFLHSFALIFNLLFLLPAYSQQNYPDKPIRLIVGFPSGQGTDVLARVLADKLSASLKQAVVVDNRPGQGGSVAMGILAKSPPDGYTIMFSSLSALVLNPHLYDKLSYDPLTELKPVSMVGELPMMVVASKSAPFPDFAGLITYAKANPDKLNFASPGMFSFLLMSLIQENAGVVFHNVPYAGSSKALVDLIAGRVDFSIDTIAAIRNQVSAGTLRLIASGSEKRLKAFPNTPTLDESGFKGIQSRAWVAVFAPKGIPDDIVKRLNTEINIALMDPSLIEKFDNVGASPKGGSPAELNDMYRAEYQLWKNVIKISGAKADN